MTLEDAIELDKLWNDPQVQEAYARCDEFFLPDAAAYLFDNIFRFVDDDYEPTEADYLMARVRTTGMTMSEFLENDLTFQIVDVGGQRSERKKWIKFFDNVQGVLFVVNLAGYRKILFEDKTRNRMHEAVELFAKIANTRAFAEIPIFCFLTKRFV
eukprot:GABV01000895.1.p1 GENE.GABV01000895.1~~GABV01000895.1.p1  ORF type:complete len:156 (+),score=69.79 GABV01000895.1:365-832(+)